MKNFNFIVGCLMLLSACNTKPKPYENYVWSSEIEKLQGEDLKEWIEKAPFKGKWDPTKTKDGKIVLTTNEEQLFPFIGSYKKEDGVLNHVEDVYQKTRMFFKEDKRGASFVHATLLTHDEELYVSDSYSEMGNVAFSGTNAINESYRATLRETKAVAEGKITKSGIYWVDVNYISYCMAFYQKKNLIVQVAFPCEISDKSMAVSKIKEVNDAMELGVPQWGVLKTEDLEINMKPKSFWKDPYVKIFPNKRYILLNDLSVKLVNTKFKAINGRKAGIDYQYGYQGPEGEVKLSFTKKEITLNELEFVKKIKEDQTYTLTLEYNHGYETNRKVYINSHQKEGVTFYKGKTYFKDNHILEILYSYPKNDKEAEETIHNVLTHLKIASTI